MQEPDGYVARTGMFSRWGSRLAQAVLREPSVILLERDSDHVSAADNSVSEGRIEPAN